MKNETIKQYTEITVEQAGEMLRDNGWKPVGGVAFMGLEENGWNHVELRGIQVGNGRYKFFAPRDSYATCATVTELDPCQSPEGCPELEPWMAYVGKGDVSRLELESNFWSDNGDHWMDGCGGNGTHDLYAIDVRTSWAQEHFPEHCRIRNYQEPDPLSKVLTQSVLSHIKYSPYTINLIRNAYELGQQNPQPTK